MKQVEIMESLINEILSLKDTQSVSEMAENLISRDWWVQPGQLQDKIPELEKCPHQQVKAEKPKEQSRIDKTKAQIEKALTQCQREGKKPTVRTLEKLSGIPRSTIGYYFQKGYVQHIINSA